MELKLLTLNLHAWQEENQLEKFQMIAEYIEKNNIDIVAFQEVSQNKDKKILFDNIREDNPAEIIKNYLMDKGKNYNFVWDWAHYGFDIYEEGLSILTKFEISHWESRFISKSTDSEFWKSRKALKTSLSIGGKKINVFSCHMGWIHDEIEPFSLHMKNLDKFIKEENELTFVMGDFNNPDDGIGYELIKNTGLYDLFEKGKDREGYTIFESIAGWEGNLKGLRIDYIFSNKKLEVLDNKVVFDHEKVSDHFGVFVKIKI